MTVSLKKVFNWDYNLCNRNWSAEVQYILDQVGYDNIFNDKSICDLKVLDQKINFLEENNWKLSVASKPKLRTYILFKETFTTEKYVQVPISRRQRSLIAQLRLGILQLKIETGRYRMLAT